MYPLILGSLLLAGAGQPAAPAEPELIGDVTAKYMAEFKVKNVPQGTAVIWDVFPDDTDTVVRIVKTEKACLIAGPAREYKVRVRLVKGEDVTSFERVFTISGGGPRPPPTPPNPPNPPPNPPVPPPGDDPFAGMNGLHVLMVYDDTKTNSMSGTQRAVLAGQTVRDYLESKCAAGPDGTKDYRIWPATVMDVSGETKPWQGAFAKPHTLTAVENGKNVPVIWMYLSDGKSSEVRSVGPGDTLDSVLATLKKYGG